ncbi:MAG: hypothetical protein K0R38_7452 [Polyangiaceae bacterium]|jgi:hypothetical protein|nr:hypothetical protein [Polyangiaceae bacterium]
MRKLKVALASVVAVFCLYGAKELLGGSRDQGLQALLIAGVAGAVLVALVLKSK